MNDNLLIKTGDDEVGASKPQLTNMIKQQALANHVLQYLLHSLLPEDGSMYEVQLSPLYDPFKIDVDVLNLEDKIIAKRILKDMNEQVNTDAPVEEKKNKNEVVDQQPEEVQEDEVAPAQAL